MNESEWWLGSYEPEDRGLGSIKLVDGAHGTRDGAEQALTIIKSLSFLDENRDWIIVQTSRPTGKHSPVNQDAIDTLNGIG